MKDFYNTKSLRERLLMLGFILIGVAWWGSALVGRVRFNVSEWQAAGRDAGLQQLWLAQEAAVGARTTAVAQQLDASRTMNATQAFTEVDRLAQGLPHDLGAQRTDRTDSFALHSLQVTFRRVDMAGLLRFYEGVSARAPYLGIDQCVINAERASPGTVTAAFRVYSVEAVRPAQ